MKIKVCPICHGIYTLLPFNEKIDELQEFNYIDDISESDLLNGVAIDCDVCNNNRKWYCYKKSKGINQMSFLNKMSNAFLNDLNESFRMNFEKKDIDELIVKLDFIIKKLKDLNIKKESDLLIKEDKPLVRMKIKNKDSLDDVVINSYLYDLYEQIPDNKDFNIFSYLALKEFNKIFPFFLEDLVRSGSLDAIKTFQVFIRQTLIDLRDTV